MNSPAATVAFAPAGDFLRDSPHALTCVLMAASFVETAQRESLLDDLELH